MMATSDSRTKKAGGRAVRLIGVLAALAAVPATAQAGQIQTERFSVEVKGVQTTSWAFDAPARGGCDTGGSGQGAEVVRFATTKPRTVEALRLSPTYAQFRARGAILGRATVVRRGSTSSGPMNPGCRGTGGEELIPPDCGTRRGPLRFAIAYEGFGKRPGVTLRNFVAPLSNDGRFANCPVNGVAYPTLLERNTNGSTVASKWPLRELMDGNAGKTILIGRGRKVYQDAHSQQETTIRWEITFRRLRAARPKASTAASGEPDCKLEARRSYRLTKAGMPVQITCDKPTTVFATANISVDSAADKLIDPRKHPATHGWTKPRVAEPGTPVKFRVRLRDFAARAIRRIGHAKLVLSLGAKWSDGRFHNNPGPGGFAYVRVTAGGR
jgi:hypothetical protein